MAQVQGIVGWSGKNKFGKFSLKLEDNETWYNSQYEINCSKGQEVTFEDMGKKYVNNLKVVGGGGAAAPSGASSAPATAGMPSDKDRMIIRQNSLSHAVNSLAYSILSDLEDNRDAVTDEIIRIARKFEEYSSGDLDRDNVPEGTAPAGDFLP